MESSNNNYKWTCLNGRYWGYQVEVRHGSIWPAIIEGCRENVDPHQYIQNNSANGRILVRWENGHQASVYTSDVTICKKIDGRPRRNHGNSGTASSTTSIPPATAAKAKKPALAEAMEADNKRRAVTATTSTTPSIPKLLMLKDVLNKRAGKTSHFNSKGVDTNFFVSGMGIIVEYGNKSLRAIIIEPIFGLQGIIKLTVKYMGDNDDYGGKVSTINVDKVTLFDEHYEGNIVPDVFIENAADFPTTVGPSI